jgi:DnaJ family protein C protein 13
MGGLGGGDLKTGQCKVVGETLVTLLGPHLVGMMRGMTDAVEVLDTVNSHVETPFLIWTSDHEKELKKKCEIWLEDIAEGEGDPECALSHIYKASESELMIRSVYVRIQIKKTDDEGYMDNIKQPEVFLQRCCQWLIDPSKVPGNVMEVTRGGRSPETLTLCLRCIEQFLVEKPERVQKVHEFRTIIKLFSFLSPSTMNTVVHQQCLKVLLLCASHPKVIEDVTAESDCLTNLLAMLKSDKASTTLALQVIEKLTTNAKVLADCVRRGCVIYILNVVGSPDKINEKAREVLQGMSKSALHGLKVTERMEQFLPGAVVNGLCNGTGEDEFKFTTECKTPELIWNDGMAQQFRAAVSGQLEDLYTAQLEDPTAVPSLDEDFQVEYESLYEETYVGGIYLRLFLQNPQYNIRKPEKFVEALLQAHEALAHLERRHGAAVPCGGEWSA